MPFLASILVYYAPRNLRKVPHEAPLQTSTYGATIGGRIDSRSVNLVEASDGPRKLLGTRPTKTERKIIMSTTEADGNSKNDHGHFWALWEAARAIIVAIIAKLIADLFENSGK